LLQGLPPISGRTGPSLSSLPPLKGNLGAAAERNLGSRSISGAQMPGALVPHQLPSMPMSPRQLVSPPPLPQQPSLLPAIPEDKGMCQNGSCDVM